MAEWSARRTSAIRPSSPALQGPFVESPGNFSVPESCFMFPGFAFNIKASIILKMVK